MIERKVKTVRALERGLQVLSEIDRRHGANLHELHLALGLPKATLLRMVVTLGKHGHIWQRLADGAFLPSARRAGASHKISSDEIAEAASPAMARLVEQVSWPAAVAVPRGDHMEIVENNAALLRLDSIPFGPVGYRVSYLHTAIGRAYLAACYPDERAAILERLRPAREPGAGELMLSEILAVAGERGYALREPFLPGQDRDLQAMRNDDRRSLAVPVMLGTFPVASISITWLQRRSDTATVVHRYLGALEKAAQAIAADLLEKRSALIDVAA